MNMGSNQFCLKWNNHNSNLLAVFEELLSSEALVDVTLVCECKSLKAHKLILSACSPFFQNLFLNNPCKHPVIILHDIKFVNLKAVIDFMYRGEINVSQDQLSTLFKTAEALNIKGLSTDRCEKEEIPANREENFTKENNRNLLSSKNLCENRKRKLIDSTHICKRKSSLNSDDLNQISEKENATTIFTLNDNEAQLPQTIEFNSNMLEELNFSKGIISQTETFDKSSEEIGMNDTVRGTSPDNTTDRPKIISNTCIEQPLDLDAIELQGKMNEASNVSSHSSGECHRIANVTSDICEEPLELCASPLSLSSPLSELPSSHVTQVTSQKIKCEIEDDDISITPSELENSKGLSQTPIAVKDIPENSLGIDRDGILSQDLENHHEKDDISHGTEDTRHSSSSTNFRPQCPYCHRIFFSPGNLKRHIEIHFLKRKNYVCPMCQKRFSWKNTLNSHLRRDHHIQI